ncbi:hypothetical protein ACLECX_17070 [Lonsdalea quercina]|uniref:hypothetical protein n=1 Tax=Lonsdalea quercina TaxID=71657 RepID=UPI003974D18B
MGKSNHIVQDQDHFRKGKNSTLLRHFCISVRLNQSEFVLLNNKRGKYKKGEWLRLVFLNHIPANIPTINIQAWKALSEISQKLNRIATHIDVKWSTKTGHRFRVFPVSVFRFVWW